MSNPSPRSIMVPKPATAPVSSLTLTQHDRPPLTAMFEPRAIALVGATDRPGSVGATILRNLFSSEPTAKLFPVNAKRDSVQGLSAFRSITAIPDRIDLAVIATPAASVPGVIEDCVSAGVPAAVIISAGFKEKGAEGASLEQRIADLAHGRMRVIGPNCLGVMVPRHKLNATFAQDIALPGNVAFLSQSGALCTAILDWSRRELVGFSAFVSMGSMVDVGWGDLIEYFGDDPQTSSIVLYMETIGDSRSFLSAAREVALHKPIIVIKAGRTEPAARAAASHTGAMTGSDDVLDAAFRRCGVLRVNTIAELFYMTEVLSKQPRPRGRRLMIVTNAGGPGVLATDRLIADGGELAVLSPETVAALDRFLPEHWSHNNPIDVLGDADPQRFAKAFAVAAADPGCDGVLAIMSPQGVTEPSATAAAMAGAPHGSKPVLASWMGADRVADAVQVINRAGIPNFPYPDTAASAFVNMWRYEQNLRMLYETPGYAGPDEVDHAAVTGILEGIRRERRTLLTEPEAKQILAAYGISVVPTRAAATEADAVAAANETGYPVALKLWSHTITHKTDVGGVELNLHTADDVSAAFERIRNTVAQKATADDFLGVTVQPMAEPRGYELIVGSSLDAQFGPVLLFGAGGQLAEVFGDRAIGLPPLNRTLARRLLERTKIFRALSGVRGRKPVDIAALETLLVRFSRLVVEQRWIREIEVNPLLASDDALIALDARAVLHPPDSDPEKLPLSAIRPYPSQYVSRTLLHDGTEVTLRPIRAEDEPLMVQFHESLSDRTTYLRYFQTLQLSRRTAHERLSRLCFVDYDRDMALVAERISPRTTAPDIIGVGRLSRLHGTADAEFAIVVSDAFQQKGLGTKLAQRLVEVAREEKIARLLAFYLPENHAMRRICLRLGMRIVSGACSSPVEAVLKLD